MDYDKIQQVIVESIDGLQRGLNIQQPSEGWRH